MALVLENADLVRQRARVHSQAVAVSMALKAFFMLWAQMEQNADLKIKFISGLEAADVVISDAACRLHFLFLAKPSGSTTDAWAKVSDHTSTAATNPDVAVKLIGTGGGARKLGCLFAGGVKLGTGATIGSHTANNGNTKSAVADAPTGFAIVGAL